MLKIYFDELVFIGLLTGENRTFSKYLLRKYFPAAFYFSCDLFCEYLSVYIFERNFHWYQLLFWPVGWGCRIHQLHLCRGVRPPPRPMSVLDMTLNNLMVRFQWCWSFGEGGAPLHCHCSQVYSAKNGSTW